MLPDLLCTVKDPVWLEGRQCSGHPLTVLYTQLFSSSVTVKLYFMLKSNCVTTVAFVSFFFLHVCRFPNLVLPFSWCVFTISWSEEGSMAVLVDPLFWYRLLVQSEYLTHYMYYYEICRLLLSFWDAY